MKDDSERALEYMAALLGKGEREQPLPEWEALRQIYRDFDEEMLLASDCPDKAELHARLHGIMERLRMQLRFPALAGRHVICWAGFQGLNRKNLTFLPKALQAPTSAVPSLTFAGSYDPTCSGGLSLHGGFHAVGPEEAVERIRSLGGLPQDVYVMLSTVNPRLDGKVVMLDIPGDTPLDNPLLDAMLNVCDEVFIPDGKNDVVYGVLERLEHEGSHAPVYVIPSRQGNDTAGRRRQLSFKYRRLTFPPRTRAWNGSTRSEGFEMENIVLALQNHLEAGVQRYEAILRRGVDNAVSRRGDDAFLNAFSMMRNQLNKERDTRLAALEKLKRFRKGVAEALHALYAAMRRTEEGRYLAADDWQEAERRFFLLLERKGEGFSSDWGRPDFFAEILNRLGYPYGRTLSLFLSAAEGAGSQEELTFLRGCDDGERKLTHRAFLLFHDSLSPEELELHARSVECRSAGEWYALGAWKKRQDDKDAVSMLRKAWLAGSGDAAHLLMSGDFQGKYLTFLADTGYREANVLLSRTSSGEKGRFYLKTAAILGDEAAMLRLAEKQAGDAAGRRTAIGLYRYLLRKGSGIMTPAHKGRLGLLLYVDEQYKDAFVLLSGIDPRDLSDNVGMFFYSLGYMYEHGYGTSVDVSKALDMYTKANKAGMLCPKDIDRLKNLKERKIRNNKNEDYSPKETGSSSSSSDGRCFLTTATCEVMGFADDCEVLQSFRQYRDTILRHEDGGEELIREYYRVAPEIIRAIDARPHREEVYHAMWSRYIEPGYELLQQQRWGEAKALYMELVTRLYAIYVEKSQEYDGI